MWIQNVSKGFLLNVDNGARFFAEIPAKEKPEKQGIRIWYNTPNPDYAPFLFDTLDFAGPLVASADVGHYLELLLMTLNAGSTSSAIARIADVLEALVYENPNVGRSGLSQLVGEIRGE